MAVKQEEAESIEKAAGITSNVDVEPEYREEVIECMDTDQEQDQEQEQGE